MTFHNRFQSERAEWSGQVERSKDGEHERTALPLCQKLLGEILHLVACSLLTANLWGRQQHLPPFLGGMKSEAQKAEIPDRSNQAKSEIKTRTIFRPRTPSCSATWRLWWQDIFHSPVCGSFATKCVVGRQSGVLSFWGISFWQNRSIARTPQHLIRAAWKFPWGRTPSNCNSSLPVSVQVLLPFHIFSILQNRYCVILHGPSLMCANLPNIFWRQ